MSGTGHITTKRQRNYEWIWLVYLGFIFIEPAVEPSLRIWLVTLVAVAVFLVLFIFLARNKDAHSSAGLWFVGTVFVLGLIVFPLNNGASTFFVYAAAFLPFAVESKRFVLWFFAVEALAITGEHYLFHARGHALYVDWPNAFIAIFLIVLIGGSNIFFAEQRRADCKLRAAQEENVALAAVAERERIARDLHDVLGHTLSVIVLKAELAGRLIELDPQRASSEIGDVERTARTALAEVREAIGGYRSRGLAAEIETARRTLDAASVSLISDTIPAAAAGLSATEETVLALALREAVTNIVRHAKAKTCRLRFVSDANTGRRRLLVEDDGEHPLAREGNGLRGMRERVEALGGSMSLNCERGTQLLIELPLRAEGTAS